MGGIGRWIRFDGDGWNREMGWLFMEMGGMWEMGGFYGDGWILWRWVDIMDMWDKEIGDFYGEWDRAMGGFMEMGGIWRSVDFREMGGIGR